MKKVLIILGLFLFVGEVFAFDRFYYQAPSSQNRLYKRPTYNPYSNTYYSPYRYKNTNYNNVQRIQRNNRIRNLNRIKNNILGWNFNRNNLNNGSLTGYSVPITQKNYNQFKKEFWDNKHSANCNTDLFSSPSKDAMYYSDGTYYDFNRDVSGTTGVKIIYD